MAGFTFETGDATACRATVRSLADDAVVIALDGELDRANADWFGDLCSAVEAAGWSTVVLDLGRVTLIDAGGMRVVATFARRLGELGHDLRIEQPGRHASLLLTLFGLDHLAATDGDTARR